MPIASLLKQHLKETQTHLEKLTAEDQLAWAVEEFGGKFVATTSFGIQSTVLLHMLSTNKKSSNTTVIWVDTGYLPLETYQYAAKINELFQLNLRIVQSEMSPARMEAIYGKLWETKKAEDLEKYHLIRKVQPLENILEELEVQCWASGVRRSQTNNRNEMNCIDLIRDRLSLRPLLEWTNKEIFYYMKEHKLPQHPLFEKGYSTVGDWHSSIPESEENQGRETRFGGIKEECGIHLAGTNGDGI